MSVFKWHLECSELKLNAIRSSVDSGTSTLLLIHAIIVLLALLNLYRQLINNKMVFFFLECRVQNERSLELLFLLLPLLSINTAKRHFLLHNRTKRMICQICNYFILWSVLILCVDNEERVKTILYNKYVEKLFTFMQLIFQARNWSVSIFAFHSFTYSRTIQWHAIQSVQCSMTWIINNKQFS